MVEVQELITKGLIEDPPLIKLCLGIPTARRRTLTTLMNWCIGSRRMPST
ncbi:hypothetical protein [Bradyrhizobium sp. USDA 4529]